MEVIIVKEAREYIDANCSDNPLLKNLALNLLDQLPKSRGVATVRVQRKAAKTRSRVVGADDACASACRDLSDWIIRNKTKFCTFTVNSHCYGTIDDKFVYITNKAFDLFCEEYLCDELDLLRLLDRFGCIVTRKPSWHGGHYKTKRIAGNLESCVWLFKDKLFQQEELQWK